MCVCVCGWGEGARGPWVWRSWCSGRPSPGQDSHLGSSQLSSRWYDPRAADEATWNALHSPKTLNKLSEGPSTITVILFIHYMHYGKMLSKKCSYCLRDAVHRLQGSILRPFLVLLLGRAWSVPFAIHSAHLSVLAMARGHEDCQSALQKTSTSSGLAMNASPMSEVCKLWISSSPKRPGSHANHPQQNKNADFSSKRTSLDPPPPPSLSLSLSLSLSNDYHSFEKKMPLIGNVR